MTTLPIHAAPSGAAPIKIETALAQFFEPPRAEHADGTISTLFLCRKELQDCLTGVIGDERALLTRDHHRLFATAMLTFSGLDLLAHMTPPPRGGGARGRFVSLLLTYASRLPTATDQQEADALWDFRNALSHTFGFYHLARDGKVIPFWLYDQNAPAPLISRRGPGWEVCLDSLVEVFLALIRLLEQDIRARPELQRYFIDAFSKYGRIQYRGPHIA